MQRIKTWRMICDIAMGLGVLFSTIGIFSTWGYLVASFFMIAATIGSVYLRSLTNAFERQTQDSGKVDLGRELRISERTYQTCVMGAWAIFLISCLAGILLAVGDVSARSVAGSFQSVGLLAVLGSVYAHTRAVAQEILEKG